MDGHKKLTRTQSSLLRSSPTIRSSIQSIGSDHEPDLEEQKPHGTGPTGRAGHHFNSPPVQSRFVSRFGPVLALTLLFTYIVFTFLNSDDIATSENLLLTLILIAIVLFFAGKHKAEVCQLIRRFSVGPTHRVKVQWYIGEKRQNEQKTEKKVTTVKEGVEVYSNGDVYEGEFHKGRCNGSGVYTFFVNGRYEGDWVDGRYDGYGIESWARGSKYRGQYRQGLRHGYGVYKFFTGDTYVGQWCNGQSHGVGVQSCFDGSCYVGGFKCGVKHGIGCYHFRNGDRYAGEYFGDKIHGFGVYHFANGHCYEGSWHEGRKQGYGMYTFRNGDSRCGEWASGNLKTPLPPLTDSVLRAVQASRKAAESAINIGRVDEQVNKAVMAANRAATAARVAAIKAVQNRMHGKFCDTNN